MTDLGDNRLVLPELAVEDVPQFSNAKELGAGPCTATGRNRPAAAALKHLGGRIRGAFGAAQLKAANRSSLCFAQQAVLNVGTGPPDLVLEAPLFCDRPNELTVWGIREIGRRTASAVAIAM